MLHKSAVVKAFDIGAESTKTTECNELVEVAPEPIQSVREEKNGMKFKDKKEFAMRAP
jgi:hypothetical protein